MEKIEITSRISNIKAMTAEEYISFCKKILLELKNILPKFNHLYTYEKDLRFYFADDLGNFDTSNIDEIISFNKDEDVFKNENIENINNRELQINSTSWIGFNSLFYFNDFFNETESLATIAISSLGAYESDKFAIIKLEFSKDYQKILSFDIINKIINILSKHTELDYAVAYTDEFFDEVFKREYKLWLGWITFINNIKVKNSFSTDTKYEKIKDGYLFYFDESKVDSKNKILLEKTIKLRDSLGNNGFLNYPQ